MTNLRQTVSTISKPTGQPSHAGALHASGHQRTPGWPTGWRATEGGNSKNTTSADVNGPRHFCLEDAETGELLDKHEELDCYRRAHVHDSIDSKVDPIRRPVARELKANKSERTEAYRRAAIDANAFSAREASRL